MPVIEQIAVQLQRGESPWGADGPQTQTDWDECAAAWRLLAYQHKATADRLREAIHVEITHGGIIDRIAHAATILGCEPAESQARQVGTRLDNDRRAFIDRIEKALGTPDNG